MRHLGNLDTPEQAENFLAYLLVQGIEGNVDTRSGPAEVWVKDEDQLAEAMTELAAFRENPSDPKYSDAFSKAKAIRKEQAKKTKAMQKKIVHVGRGGLNKKPHLTMLLIALCGLVALFTNFGMLPGGNGDVDRNRRLDQKEWAAVVAHKTQPLYRWLQFTCVGSPAGEQLAAEYLASGKQDDLRYRTASLLRGEVWRLITPIFVHYGFMHIVFNLYMLFSYGSLVERRYDWKRLLLLVLLSAAIPNFVQCTVPEAWQGSVPHLLGSYLITSLGGMSGVVYGLFGYVWVKSIYDPKFGFRIPQSSIIIMMVWLFGCMFAEQLSEQLKIGIFPSNVANWAHGIGLLVGMVVAYLQSLEGK